MVHQHNGFVAPLDSSSGTSEHAFSLEKTFNQVPWRGQTMRTHPIATLLTLAIVALAVPVLAADGTVYGDGVTLEKATPITELLENPAAYDGKTIRVDGVITGVCKKRGCWVQITDPDTGKGVRIKVEDGVIVFPLESMGHPASAQGTFRVIHLTAEQKQKIAEHRAKEHAAEGGHEACESEPIGDTVVVIQGTGAIIR